MSIAFLHRSALEDQQHMAKPNMITPDRSFDQADQYWTCSQACVEVSNKDTLLTNKRVDM